MSFTISKDHPVRQVFGYEPGRDIREDRESLGEPYLMADEYISRCKYVGRDGRAGIYFKDFVTGWVFAQPREHVILNNP